MSETILRQLAMLRLVPRAPRSITATALVDGLAGEGFEVSLRSVQRDLETLSVLFPLLCDDTAKPYTWSWEKDALRDLPGMDTPTALTFALAGRFLAPLLPAEVDPAVLDVVYEALLTGRRLRCAYHRKGQAERRDYEVNPLGLVVREAVSYLVATLWGYADILQLALHRMTGPALLDRAVTAIPGFDLDAYIAEGAFGYRMSEGTIRLKVRFSDGAAQHLYETPLSADQVVTQEITTGTTLLEAPVLDTAELRWWLLGFGDQVEVLAPAELREVFRENALTLCAIYRNR